MELVIIFMVMVAIEIIMKLGLKVWNYFNPDKQYRIKESADDEEPGAMLLVLSLISIIGSMFIMCL